MTELRITERTLNTALTLLVARTRRIERSTNDLGRRDERIG
jgi:hypothetical protein